MKSVWLHFDYVYVGDSIYGSVLLDKSLVSELLLRSVHRAVLNSCILPIRLCIGFSCWAALFVLAALQPCTLVTYLLLGPNVLNAFASCAEFL